MLVCMVCEHLIIKGIRVATEVEDLEGFRGGTTSATLGSQQHRWPYAGGERSGTYKRHAWQPATSLATRLEQSPPISFICTRLLIQLFTLLLGWHFDENFYMKLLINFALILWYGCETWYHSLIQNTIQHRCLKRGFKGYLEDLSMEK
jgi:hypothetical protein